MTRERTGRPQFGAMPFRLCIFFALNPDEILTSKDVADKYDIVSNSVTPRLKALVGVGYIKRDVSPQWPHRTVYSAGPALLEMAGIRA